VVAVVLGLSLLFFLYFPFGLPRDTISEAVVAELSGHRGPILSCAFSPDSATLATASADGTIRVWETSAFQLRKVLAGHSVDVRDIAFSPDGRHMLSASWDCKVLVWDTSTWQTVTVIDRRPRESLSVAFSPDGARFAVAGGKGKGSIQVYESDTCRLSWEGTVTAFDTQRAAYSPDGLSMVTSDNGGFVTLWDSRTGQVLGSFQVTTPGIIAVEQLAFGSSPFELFVRDDRGRSSNTIAEWDLRQKRLKLEDRASGGSYTGFAFSPDRKLLARMWRRVNHHYGELQLLTRVGGDMLATVRCRNSYLGSSCFSPDGRYIATGGEWGTCVALVWDVEKILHTTSGHSRGE
jgi:WD40 repeat protein